MIKFVDLICHSPRALHKTIPPKLQSLYTLKKSDAVNTLIRYIKLIYKYLNAIEMCFTTGSFVIEDRIEALLDVLIVSSSTSLECASSHRSLNPIGFEKEIDGIKYVSTSVNESHINGTIDGEIEKGMPILCSHLQDNEGNAVIDKRFAKNIKWYKFFNGEKKNFVFFKLERYKTFSKKHLLAANERYVKHHDTKSEYTSRREDCKERCVYLKDSSMKKNIDEIVIEGTSYRVDENYERTGDEFFIPEVLSDYFLKLIEKRYDIDYDIKIIKQHYTDKREDVVTITVESKIVEGGRKKRVLKKKILQKK
jgi:hypothetical protein